MRTLTVILTLGLITSACGDDKGTSETETGGPSTGGSTTGTSTGPGSDATTTAPTTTDPTTTDPTTSAGPTTEPDATTGPSTTTGPEDTDVPETGIVEGLNTVIEDRCAPDDGPGLEFKVGVASTQCGADFPEDGPIITISLWQGGPLEPGYYELANGGGFATFDDGNGVQMTEKGTISLLQWGAGFPYGGIELSLPDGTIVAEGFEGIYCPSEPPCK